MEIISNGMEDADDWSSIDRISFAFPAKDVVEIYNALPVGSKARDLILASLKSEAEKNDKAHWIRGLVITDDGSLAFDARRYKMAVSRGKQETYYGSVKDLFDNLTAKLGHINRYQRREIETAQTIKDDHALTALVSLPEMSSGVAALQSRADALERLVNQMEGGLPNLFGDTQHVTDGNKKFLD